MGKMIVKGITYGGGDCANQNLADEFSESSTYEVDEYVIYQDDLYKCTTAVSTAGPWDSTKWTRANITDEMGGGSGEVVDVYVNGASVLDVNKIAQITNYVELTQAQYDALPASKLTDNILYCIKDAASGNPAYAGMQETLLYTATNNTLVDIAVDLTSYDAYLIRPSDGVGQSGNTYFFTAAELARLKTNSCKLTLYDYANSIMEYTVTNTGFTAVTRYNGNFVIWEIIGLKFIPTVIQANGSSSYSTTEHAVGTWIDGSTVYEKTIYYAGGTNGLINIEHNISNFGQPISCEGVCRDADGAGTGYFTFSRISSDGYNIGITGINYNYITFYVPSVFSSRIVDVYLTLKYIKSSS